MQATIAAKKDCNTLVLLIGSLITSKIDNENDARIIGIDKIIENIAAFLLSNPKNLAPVIVTPALLAPGINARI